MLWLQADQLSGLLDGDPLPAWPDATGAGPIATQGAAANQPSYRTAQVNGKPVVRFSGDGVERKLMGDYAPLKKRS